MPPSPASARPPTAPLPGYQRGRVNAVHSKLALAFIALLAFPPVLTPPPQPAVKLGVDVLLDQRIELVAGKRVGLVTNASGVDGRLVPTSLRLHEDRRVKLVQLFAPEHGLVGFGRNGESVDDGLDPVTGVRLEGLLGKRRRPSPEALRRVDVLLFDIQDVGNRPYTYITTLGEAMTAACAAGVPFVVLDRPNPLGGYRFEGPVRLPAHKSFIGWGPLPVTHGMTVGELARFYDQQLGLGCDLTVVEMQGWKRWMLWRDTGLSWVPTSPAIPHAETALVYPATGMFGGITTNVNEGVGTTWPFESIAAEWIDPMTLWRAMAAEALPGVRFRPITYKPRWHYRGKDPIGGVQLVVTDPRTFRPVRTALALMTTVERLYPGQIEFRSDGAVARVWGIPRVPERVRAGESAASFEASFEAGLRDFAAKREAALIYPLR